MLSSRRGLVLRRLEVRRDRVVALRTLLIRATTPTVLLWRSSQSERGQAERKATMIIHESFLHG